MADGDALAFDASRFARDLEALYAAMIACLRAGAPPDHLLPGAA